MGSDEVEPHQRTQCSNEVKPRQLPNTETFFLNLF